jgi:hypothetical protein
MERIPSSILIIAHVVNKFMEPEISLRCLQVAATCSYPGSDEPI